MMISNHREFQVTDHLLYTCVAGCGEGRSQQDIHPFLILAFGFGWPTASGTTLHGTVTLPTFLPVTTL